MDQIPKAVKGTVQSMLDKKDERKVQDLVCEQFGELLVKSASVCVHVCVRVRACVSRRERVYSTFVPYLLVLFDLSV